MSARVSVIPGQPLLAIDGVPTYGRSGIRFDSASGLPTGLTGGVLEDVDLALAIARAQAIRVVFPVLDFSIQKSDAHPQVVRTDSGRKAVKENVLSPVLARYAREDSILAWEVMNEPEYVTSDFLESPYVTLSLISMELWFLSRQKQLLTPRECGGTLISYREGGQPKRCRESLPAVQQVR